MWNLSSASKGQKLLIRGFNGLLNMIALDARSLALFRIMIALTSITDVMTRFPDAHHHYSDAGMFPREFILRAFTNYYWITLHMLSGSEFVMQLLFIAEILVALCLLVGYRTRTMTIITWIFVCSVQNRNYILGHSGDTVHRLFLFWGIFLPLGRCFSVDRALASASSSSSSHDIDENYHDHDPDHEKRRQVNTPSRFRIANFATTVFTIQLLIMYYMAHHHKTSAEWRETGVAAWMALQLDYFRTWFGDLLLIWTQGVIYANFAVLKWQHWGSMLYFCPFYNKYCKAFVCLGFFAMHAGFGMAFYLETFTWATISAVFGAIPGWVWDLAIKYLSSLALFSKPIQIHVISNCRFCLNLAKILDQFMLPNRSIVHTTSHLPTSSLPCTCGSKCNWNDSHFLGISVTDQQKNIHHGPAIFAAIAKSSPILYPLHYIFRTKPARNCLQFLSRVMHHHTIHATDDVAMEEATDAKFAYRPHYENRYSNGVGSSGLPLSNFNGIVVDLPEFATSKKEIFEDQSTTFTMQDVKEATIIGMKAMKEAFLAFLLFLIICNNVGNVDHQYGVPPPLQPVLWIFQLDQYWGMFAPRPPDITWWYNFEGYLDDGTHVELFNDGAMHTFVPNIPHTFDKPDIHESIGNHRWFKLFENGLNSHSQREEIRLYFGRWFCREFNARNHGPKRVQKYSIHFMYERLNMQLMDGSRYPPARETIWNHICYEK